MLQRIPALLLALAMALQTPVAGQTGGGSSADLAAGIRQVDEGDLESAVVTLGRAIEQLKLERGRETDLSLAHLYLAVAQLGLQRSEEAKANMLEAWRNNKDLKLDPKSFSPRVLQLFQQAKEEGSQASAPAAAPAAAPPLGPQTVQAKPRGKSKTPLIAGVGAAAVLGLVLAASGGSDGGSPRDTYPRVVPLKTVSLFGQVECDAASTPCAGANDHYEIRTVGSGEMEARLTSTAPDRLFLRLLLPSGHVLEGGPAASALKVPVVQGTYVLSVWQRPSAAEPPAPYELWVRFP